MTDEELAVVMESAPWRQAKSSDHQYILQEQNPEVWQAIVDRIGEHGQWGSWFSWRQRYVLFNGYRYWRMGGGPENIVLNRARHHAGDIRWNGTEPSDLYRRLRG
jgi:hypothetical protein